MIKRLLSAICMIGIISSAVVADDKTAAHGLSNNINYDALEQTVTSNLKKYSPYALYSKSIADNQMAVLVISDRELNRIFVANDRILAVRGIDGAYLLNKDENQGEIFIKPSAIYQARAFSIFVTTEQGHNYNLILVPVNIPARTIELKPLTGSKQAERWERDGDYMEIIASLMTAMVNAKTPDGYALIVPHKEQVAVFDELKIVVTLVYSGKYLRGEVLSVTNESKHAVYLDERQFYHPNVRALALIEHNLEPKSKTLLYRVVSDE